MTNVSRRFMKIGRFLLFSLTVFVGMLVVDGADAQQLNSTGDWTPWQTNGAYGGVDVRAMCQHGGPSDAQYFVQFRNRYPESVHLTWSLTSSGPTTGGPYSVNLGPGVYTAPPTHIHLLCGGITSPDLIVNISEVNRVK